MRLTTFWEKISDKFEQAGKFRYELSTNVTGIKWHELFFYHSEELQRRVPLIFPIFILIQIFDDTQTIFFEIVDLNPMYNVLSGCINVIWSV